MTEAEKAEHLRESILCDLQGVAPFGDLNIQTLTRGARVARGLAVTESEIVPHLKRLKNEGLLEEKRSALSSGVVRYKITETGIKLLIELGLA